MNPQGKRIGLALSGGGFRATLYHLGLVRFLFDAGILPSVSHITSVSGGSIFAAHLCLNWDRYTRSAEDFDAAAAELLGFIRLDVRNRILRRFPLALPLRPLRRLAGRSNRKLTRTGLLEYHYERYLYGDTSLFELPEKPYLHILATNLSEGRLASFTRDGLWMMRYDRGGTTRIERVSIGLATVPMAVAASSAFPGFFPPITWNAEDVGAPIGAFGQQQSYTDGGVFDNLGIRMFHFLARAEGEDKDKRPWDGVLVSDVGKPFQVQSGSPAGGLVRTALRASDILMDRVWQLENETFQDSTGFVFARFTDIVDRQEDPTALHPEIQRQVATIRTDLDRFSPLEMSCLIRHGYCAGRKACRALPAAFGTDLPANPPWTPMLDGASAPDGGEDAVATARASRQPARATTQARALHASGVRRIWSTLLDYRDWTSYIYVPLILPILVLTPYLSVKWYQQSQRINQIIESLAQGSRDVEQMSRLLEGTVPPFAGDKAIGFSISDSPDLSGFTILQDLRMIDLRNWTPDAKHDARSYVYGYRRLKIRRDEDNTSINNLRVSVLALSPETQVRFPPQQLQPKLYARTLDVSPEGEERVQWQVGVDFEKVPAGETVDLIYEHVSPGRFVSSGVGSTSMSFSIEAETAELNRWLLLPKGKEYKSWQMLRHKTGQPETVEHVKPVTEYLAENNTILAFKLLGLVPGYTHEITWFYR